MPITLHPSQRDVLAGIDARWNEGKRAPLVVMATGGGKTVVFGTEAIRWATEFVRSRGTSGGRVLVLCHRDKLVEQARDTFRMLGVNPELEKGPSIASGACPIVVASQPAMKARRLARYPRDYFRLIVADEAHHSITSGWTRIFSHFQDARILGVTATADRTDKISLSKVYDCVVEPQITINMLVDRFMRGEPGGLVPPYGMVLDTRIDLEGVKKGADGELDANDVMTRMIHVLGRMAQSAAPVIASRRKAVCFLPTINAAKVFAHHLRGLGIAAYATHGLDKHRSRIEKAYAANTFKCLCNADLYTEGFDDRAVDTVGIFRPVRSRLLYTQIVGRGLRLSPETNKRECMIVTPFYLHKTLSLCHPASIMGEQDDEVDVEAAEIVRTSGGNVSLIDAVERAQRSVANRRDLAARLASEIAVAPAMLSPDEYLTARENFDERTTSRGGEPPTDKQVMCLRRLGLDPATVKTSRDAARIIAAGR